MYVQIMVRSATCYLILLKLSVRFPNQKGLNCSVPVSSLGTRPSHRSCYILHENNVHRKFLVYNRRDSASQMFVSNNLLNFEAILRKCTLNCMERLQFSNNVLIRTLSMSFSVPNGAMCEKWNNL